MKYTIILVSFISYLLLLSCQNTHKTKIGFLIPNLVSERYVKEREYFSKKVQELGGEAVVISADYNEQTQIQQAKELIDQGVKVLVVNPVNQNTAAAIVRDAHDHHVKVIAYDRLIRNCDLDYFLTFDSEKVGKLMADYLIKIKPKGNYILLGGDKADQNAVWVKDGQKKALAPYLNSGGIKIVYDTYIEDWSGENARYCIQKFLDLSGVIPDAILSSYDGMSTGVIDLLKEYKLAGKILITGQDAELAACQNIAKDYQIMTIYKSVNKLAIKAADLAMKLSDKENITDISTRINNGKMDIPTIFLDPVIVDKSNLKSTIIADGFHSEKDIFH